MAEDKGFEVVDKRGSAKAKQKRRAPRKAPAQPKAPQEEPTSQQTEETQEAPQEEPRAADAYSIAAFALEMLAGAAWRSMGIQVDPKSGKIEKDMDEARFAIDCVMALSDKLAPRLDETALREVRGLISNLQINFVNQSGKEE